MSAGQDRQFRRTRIRIEAWPNAVINDNGGRLAPPPKLVILKEDEYIHILRGPGRPVRCFSDYWTEIHGKYAFLLQKEGYARAVAPDRMDRFLRKKQKKPMARTSIANLYVEGSRLWNQ